MDEINVTRSAASTEELRRMQEARGDLKLDWIHFLLVTVGSIATLRAALDEAGASVELQDIVADIGSKSLVRAGVQIGVDPREVVEDVRRVKALFLADYVMSKAAHKPSTEE